MISSVRFKNTKKDWMSGVKPKDHVGPIADRDLLVPLTNKSIQENSSSFQMLYPNRRWMVKILGGICLFSILFFSFYLFYSFGKNLI